MIAFTQQQKLAAYRKAPEAKQEAAFSESIADKIEEVTTKHNLMGDAALELKHLIGAYIINLVNRDTLLQNIEDVSIQQDVLATVIPEIERFIKEYRPAPPEVESLDDLIEDTKKGETALKTIDTVLTQDKKQEAAKPVVPVETPIAAIVRRIQEQKEAERAKPIQQIPLIKVPPPVRPEPKPVIKPEQVQPFVAPATSLPMAQISEDLPVAPKPELKSEPVRPEVKIPDRIIPAHVEPLAQTPKIEPVVVKQPTPVPIKRVPEQPEKPSLASLNRNMLIQEIEKPTKVEDHSAAPIIPKVERNFMEEKLANPVATPKEEKKITDTAPKTQTRLPTMNTPFTTDPYREPLQ